MDTVDWLVLIGGIGTIIFTLWFFLGPKAKMKIGSTADVQEVTVVVEGGYSPAQIEVKKGLPVRINFDRRESGECSEYVAFADLNIKKKLTSFKTTSIEFTPKEVGEISFTCGMGMLQGKVIVGK